MSLPFRNIALIAHVDHGKTTLVDAMLQQSGLFDTGRGPQERVMDNMDLERERGITILAKTTSVRFGDLKINICDTPGHADFGGEVERTLVLVDGVLLLVDAAEGPRPQTRFVLRKALERGLPAIVIINKMDRPDARAPEVLDEVYDLFIELGANDEQINFPVIYGSARDGWAVTDPNEHGTDLRPLFETIVQRLPAPDGDDTAPLSMLITNLDADDYVGRLGIGRIRSGRITKNDAVMILAEDGPVRSKVAVLFSFEGLKRSEVASARAGDIVAVAGLSQVDVGDTLADVDNPVALPRLAVEEPSISMVFGPNTGPLSGRSGDRLTSRTIKERLEREARGNPAIRLAPGPSGETITVEGRGELQLAILIEMMRREGFELCVSRPEVIVKTVDGERHEPNERVVVDLPQESFGSVSEAMSRRKSQLVDMTPLGTDRTRAIFEGPSRGLIGLRGEFLTLTRGEGVMNRSIEGWRSWAGSIRSRINGSIVCDRNGTTRAYALNSVQDRGRLFIGAGIEVYEGMIIGENSRENDMDVNATKEKKLTNIRASGSDENIVLTPPIEMTLEKALAFIRDDELVEITPAAIRLRKKVLKASERPKSLAKADAMRETLAGGGV